MNERRYIINEFDEQGNSFDGDESNDRNELIEIIFAYKKQAPKNTFMILDRTTSEQTII